MFETKYVAKKR